MTIKEIEARSGLTRANIRFYEAEGLLAPVRKDNGYRDYTENDLAALLRIRLMRALRVPLEDIRRLQNGNQTLPEALDRQLYVLAAEQTALARSQEVCRELLSNGATYETLDAQRWLDVLVDGAAVPADDSLPKVGAPCRRFFARMLDLAVYRSLISAVLVLVFHVNLRGADVGVTLLQWFGGIVLMLFIEPLFLSRLGTTPGKWLLGLGMTDPDGQRLTYEAAYERTSSLLFRGMGFGVPLIRLWPLWKCFRTCETGDTLPWEGDSVLVLWDEKPWRIAAYTAAYAMLAAAIMLCVLLAELPPHRGDLTVAEFCDNYNHIAEYYAPDAAYRLDKSGQWTETADRSVFVVSMDNLFGLSMPPLSFTEQDGYVTGVSFSQTAAGGEIPPSYADTRAWLTLALAGARHDAGLTMRQAREAAQELRAHPYASLDLSAYGVRIVTDIEACGYAGDAESGRFLFPQDDGAAEYAIRFFMSIP